MSVVNSVSVPLLVMSVEVTVLVDTRMGLDRGLTMAGMLWMGLYGFLKLHGLIGSMSIFCMIRGTLVPFGNLRITVLLGNKP